MTLCRACGRHMVRRPTYYLCLRCLIRTPRRVDAPIDADRQCTMRRTTWLPLPERGEKRD